MRRILAIVVLVAACGGSKGVASPPGTVAASPTPRISVSPTTASLATPRPSPSPDITVIAVHVVGALDELVALTDSGDAVGAWANSESAWLIDHGVVRNTAFTGYTLAIVDLLNAVVDGTDMTDEVRALLAFRPTIAAMAPGLVPSPPPADEFVALGEHTTVTLDDEDWAVITVADPSTHAKYGSYDKPAKGNVYIQVHLKYEALDDDVDYNPYDWTIYCDGELLQDGYALVFDGPSPEFHSGTLKKGRRVQGWMVLEVPKTGQVLMAYEDDVFEVLVRVK